MIASITTRIEYIELKTPFKTALRETSQVELVRVYVKNEKGLLGIGEAPATKAITGEDLETITNFINSIKNDFINLHSDECLSVLHSSTNIGSSAKTALDMAFISLSLKEKNKSFIEYFKTKDLTPIKTNITISLTDIKVMLSEAKKACKGGMDILKVKLGNDISHSIEVIQKISYELPSAKILVDANQAWSLEKSLEFIEAMRDVKIELIEQPVVANDLSALKKITQVSHIPILADEAVFTLDDVKRVIESQSANMINIKLMKCGGVIKAIEILEYAREKNIVLMLGSMLEGTNSIAIAIHLAMAYRDVIKYIDLDSPLLYKKLPKMDDFEYIGNEIRYKK
ncbi:MAG: dipeptide epimerase [Sulfurimonas sp.]|nr:dipeptide epimerase [Sulfurimonas sp.]